MEGVLSGTIFTLVIMALTGTVFWPLKIGLNLYELYYVQ